MKEERISSNYNKFVDDYVKFRDEYSIIKTNYIKIKSNNFTSFTQENKHLIDYNIDMYLKMINIFQYNCELLRCNITKSDKKNEFINNSFKVIKKAYKSTRKKIKNKEKYLLAFNYKLVIKYKEILKAYEYIITILYPDFMSTIDK